MLVVVGFKRSKTLFIQTGKTPKALGTTKNAPNYTLQFVNETHLLLNCRILHAMESYKSQIESLD
ncbi:hypothetical protein NHP190003_16230 (plasmid) [Helicobacter sp. NHP19-003]|uniref:Uncharacterized protein n=1 Tax=Helicobacter gastrocanis TaxID=2849641 RepID=A0ABN6I438_9HELI|nr:hypothetical protein NHP190003_16230 [Helicobacter sp. NHP19-003]